MIDELLFSKQIIRAKNTHVKGLTDALGKQEYGGLIEYWAWFSPVEGEDYEAEEIAAGFALATTSSDCPLQLITPLACLRLGFGGQAPLIPSASSGQALRGEPVMTNDKAQYRKQCQMTKLKGQMKSKIRYVCSKN